MQNVNEAPIITGDATLSYPENTATTRVLDRYTAADPERGQLTWSLSGVDADDFRIDQSGNLTFDSIPDYESPDDTGGNNEYQLTVVATDDGLPSQDGRFDVTLSVTNLNEGPEISRDSNAPGSLPENTGTDLVLARCTPPTRRVQPLPSPGGVSPAPTAATS